MKREEMLAQMQKSFMSKAYAPLAQLKNWPNASVCTIAQVNELIPELCKVPYDYLFGVDATAMAECSLLVQEYLELNQMSANLDMYNFEIESMGAKMSYHPDHAPEINRSEYLISSKEDLDKIKFHGLDSGRFPYLIEYCNAYMKYTGIPTFPVFSAPWTMACNLYGLDNVIMDTFEEPDFVKEILHRIVVDFHKPMFDELCTVLPKPQVMTFADAFVSPPMCNMHVIREFVEPCLEEEREVLGIPVNDSGIWGTSQVQGEERDEFNDFIIKISGCISGFDPDAERLTPEYFRKTADDKKTQLILGLYTGLLQSGPVDKIIERTKHYVLAGKKGLTPFLFFFSNISPQTPMQNYFAALQAVKIYGKPGADENTLYTEPEWKSFEHFIKEKKVSNQEGYTFKWLEKSGLSTIIE